MPNFELTLPNINVDVEVASGSFVVIRQPTQTLNRSSIPIQNVAESAITASYALTSSVTLSTVSASYALTASYVSGATATWNTVTNKPSGLVSGAAQITSLGFISQSITPTGTVSSSAQITAFGFISQSVNTGSFATTGSNTFVGYQIVSGAIYMGTGSIILPNGTAIYDIGSLGVTSGIGLGNNGFGIDFGSNVNDWARFTNANLIQMEPSNQFSIILAGNETGWSFNGSGMQFPDLTTQTTAYPGPIETGSFATTGSNTFVGNQIVSGNIHFEEGKGIVGYNGGNSSSLFWDGTNLFKSQSGQGLQIKNTAGYTQIGTVIYGMPSASDVWAATIDFTEGSNNNSGIQMSVETGENQYQWFLTRSGSLMFPDNTHQTTAFTGMILPTSSLASPQTGSMYFSGSYIYVYDGTQYRSASLN